MSSSMGRMTSHILWKMKTSIYEYEPVKRSVWYNKVHSASKQQECDTTFFNQISCAEFHPHASKQHRHPLIIGFSHVRADDCQHFSFHHQLGEGSWKWKTWCPTSEWFMIQVIGPCGPSIFLVPKRCSPKSPRIPAFRGVLKSPRMVDDPKERSEGWHLGTFRRYRNERFP